MFHHNLPMGFPCTSYCPYMFWSSLMGLRTWGYIKTFAIHFHANIGIFDSINKCHSHQLGYFVSK